MAYLKKRNGNYYIVFKTSVDGKSIQKTYTLGTRYKKIAEQKKVEYEKLYDSGEINPFEPGWNLKDYEQKQHDIQASSNSSNYLDDLKEEFIKARTNLTEKTKNTYVYIIEAFSRQVGKTMPVTKITESDIREFCLKDDLANASKRNYHRHLKAFFNWLVEEEIIDENPCRKIRLPKAKDNLVDKIISEDELDKLFKTFRQEQLKLRKEGRLRTPIERKLWFKPLVTLAFYTGLRRKEIIQLQWSHVQLEHRFLRVTDTKSGAERAVPILDPLYYRLLAWKRLMGDPKKGLVFPHPKSTSRHQFPLTGDHASKTFKKFADAAGFKDTINFHGLRHSCATFLLRQGFNVIEVKDMLGHTSVEVTNKYIHLVANDLLAAANRHGLISDK